MEYQAASSSADKYDQRKIREPCQGQQQEQEKMPVQQEQEQMPVQQEQEQMPVQQEQEQMPVSMDEAIFPDMLAEEVCFILSNILICCVTCFRS